MVRSPLLVLRHLRESVFAVIGVERLSRFRLGVGSCFDLVSAGTGGSDGGGEDREDGDDVGEVHGDGDGLIEFLVVFWVR